MTRVKLALLPLLLVAPVLTGCLGDEPIAETDSAVAGSASDAGAKSGEAPVAPKEAYLLDDETTAYPVSLPSNAARAPLVIDFSGEFKPGDCRPFRFGDLEQVLGAASAPRRFLDLSDELAVGDVFSYTISLSFVNAPDNWGEIHPAYGIGNTRVEHQESTQEMTDVLIEYVGQGYRATEDDSAWLFIGCYFSQMQRPIPYTFSATFTFAEAAIPAEAPVLITVPEGATKLIVRGVPLDDSKGVLSHFRVFDAKDQLVCECALSSSEEATTLDLPEAGEYVVLVDHTDNGFVAFALDAPPTVPARVLEAEWVTQSLFVADGGAQDAILDFSLPKVPLLMHAMVLGKDSAGAGKKTLLSIVNGRGEPLRIGWGGHVTADLSDDDRMWTGAWPGDWEYVVDHHAFAEGPHQAHLTAEELRGEVFLVTRQYVR